jgi:hypothetical protein
MSESAFPLNPHLYAALRDAEASIVQQFEVEGADPNLSRLICKGMCVRSIPNLVFELERVERLNRAINICRDLEQCWNDRLVLEWCSKVKEYRSGRMALILDVNVNVRGQSDTAGLP